MLNRLLDPLDWNRLRPWAWALVALAFTAVQVEKLLDGKESWIPYGDWGLLALATYLLVVALRDAWRHERDYRRSAAADTTS